MIAVVTRDRRYREFLESLVEESGFTLTVPEQASLLLVDLDTERPPYGRENAALTLSGDVFKLPDLSRPFLKSELISLIKKHLFPTASVVEAKERSAPSQTLVWENGRLSYGALLIRLTPAEARLFALLFEHKGSMVPLADCEAVCRKRRGEGNSVAVVMTGLRRKIETITEKRLFITYRGRGYGMVE